MIPRADSSSARRLVGFALVAVLLLHGLGPAWAAAPAPLPESGAVLQDAATPPLTNEWCPVLTDEAVDPEISTEHDGRLVFLCCRKCLKQFEADPEAYLPNLPVALASQATRTAEHGHGESSGHADQPDHDDHGQQDDPESEEHDHSQHEEGSGSGLVQLVARIGRLHPMVIHFPIALLLVSALAELLASRGKQEQFAFAARFCLWAGALGALVAAPLGWADALGVEASYTGFSAELLGYHRWVGTSTALVAALTLFACERHHRQSSPVWRKRYRAGLALCVLLVGVTGHLGASLIYGWEYLLP